MTSSEYPQRAHNPEEFAMNTPTTLMTIGADYMPAQQSSADEERKAKIRAHVRELIARVLMLSSEESQPEQ